MTTYYYITTKPNALMPREAAQLVTKDASRSETIDEAALTIEATRDPAMKRIDIPDNSVLLMYGMTDDLLAGCTQAISDGIERMAVQGTAWHGFGRYFARIDDGWHTVTLLAIGPESFWNQGPDPTQAGWRVPKGRNQPSVIQFTDGSSSSLSAEESACIPIMLLDCRDQSKKATI
jgi:hypothetical protein